MFFKKNSLHLGIDLGAFSLKAVLIEKTTKGNILKNYGYLKSSVKGKKDFTDEEIIALLKQLLIKMKIKPDIQVAFSLPVSQSFITELFLPPMSPEEVAASVEFQAKQHIPVPLEEVSISWQIINEPEIEKLQNNVKENQIQSKTQIAQSNKTKVLLAAAPKNIVERYQTISKNLKLRLKGLEIETFSLARSCIADSDVYLIVDIGAKNTNMTVVANKYLRLNRNLELGGENFTSVIAKGLNIDWDRAEKLKTEQGLIAQRGEEELTKFLYPLIDKIIVEIDRVVSTYQLRENRDIREIILSGGSSRLNGLNDYLERQLGYPIKNVNPWLKLIYPKNLEQSLNRIGPSFAVAVGLALL